MRYLWIFLALVQHAAAEISWENRDKQGFSASAVFSPESLSLFEQLHVALTLTYPAGYHPNLPEIRNHLFQNIGIGEAPFTLESEKIGTPQAIKNGFLTQTVAFELSPKFAGHHPLTFMGIPFDPDSPKTGAQAIVMSGIATITVTQPPAISFAAYYEPPLLPLSQTLPVDLSPSNKEQLVLTPEKKEREARLNEERFYAKSLPWLSLGLLILAILYAISFIKKRQAQPPPSKVGNPKAKALQRLQGISPDSMSLKEMYLQLTAILNEFIGEYYHIQALPWTSEEFIKAMSTLPLFQQADNRNSMQEFLNTADKIKFGHLIVSVEQTHQDLQTIKNLINKA